MSKKSFWGKEILKNAVIFRTCKKKICKSYSLTITAVVFTLFSKAGMHNSNLMGAEKKNFGKLEGQNTPSKLGLAGQILNLSGPHLARGP